MQIFEDMTFHQGTAPFPLPKRKWRFYYEKAPWLGRLAKRIVTYCDMDCCIVVSLHLAHIAPLSGQLGAFQGDSLRVIL